MRYVYVIEREADGSYSTYVADLPGCTTCGDTADAVRRSIGDAVASYADALRADGLPLPEPTTAFGTVDAA